VSEQAKLVVKIALLVVGLVVVGALANRQLRKASVTGEEGMQAYYFDESEQRLYLAARESVPPLVGVGGAENDGVRAIVVACRGECEDESKRKVAYYETYAPPLKQLFEDIRSARAKGDVYEGKGVEREGDFVAKNTMVRRDGETNWHAMNTKEGMKIVDEWKSWRCGDGRGMVVCTPE
jgi:hypothetical protein